MDPRCERVSPGFEDVAFLFTSDNRNRGTLRMNFDEAALLWKSVRATHGGVLEIGRRFGGSTVLLALAAPDRTITSIDIAPEHAPVAQAFFDRPEIAARLELPTARNEFPVWKGSTA
jgi:predicted O-methyltransferase YrrM